ETMASAVRKRPPPVNDIDTRPANFNTKKGKDGAVVKLSANYFRLKNKPEWCLFQYRVDIAPEEERTIVKKALLRTHKDDLGAYLFDGTVLYTIARLPQPLELNSIRQEDKQPMNIKIRLVGDLAQGDYHYVQFFNILMRRCLEHLNLQLVGRNYFDAASRVEVREHKIDLWPGYLTSIRQHEKEILMCSDITHKVMRNQTLLDVLGESYSADRRNYQTVFKNTVIGCVVLTDYNNRTYRIDDVDFRSTPNSTFKMRDGTDMSYANYYKQRYQINIRDMRQPLLVSRSKARDRRAGQDELIYLIPELCRSTGLTDAMRNDFRLMKALADHTRVPPEQRIQKLMNFSQRLRGKREILEEFSKWNFELDTNLIELSGRIIPGQLLYFGRKKTLSPKNADWNFDLQAQPQLIAPKLSQWVAIVPDRNVTDAQ
ncbi:hypothetical protein QAD02_002080, partial [Eretmocerus hayati]